MTTKAVITRTINRYRYAVDAKAFQGTIPRYESEESMAAWDAIDEELDAAERALRKLMEKTT